MRSTLLALAIGIRLILPASTMAQQTGDTCITITGTPAHAVHAEIISDKNLASMSFFSAGHRASSGQPGEARDLLKFDISSIPVGAVITSATLSLYHYTDTDSIVPGQTSYGPKNNTYLLPILSLRTDSTLTWNLQLTTDNDSKILLPQSTGIDQDNVMLDVAPFVQAWVQDPKKNYGIMAKMVTINYYNWKMFCSGHHPDSGLWPSLMICYNRNK